MSGRVGYLRMGHVPVRELDGNEYFPQHHDEKRLGDRLEYGHETRFVAEIARITEAELEASRERVRPVPLITYKRRKRIVPPGTTGP